MTWWDAYGWVCDEEDDVPLRTYTRTGLRIRRLWLWWRGFLAPPQTKVEVEW